MFVRFVRVVLVTRACVPGGAVVPFSCETVVVCCGDVCVALFVRVFCLQFARNSNRVGEVNLRIFAGCYALALLPSCPHTLGGIVVLCGMAWRVYWRP